MKGDLLYRPPRGNGEWIIKSVEIVDNSIYIKNINDENPETIENLEIIELDTTCGVFETNLGPNAFEIVTPRKILHFISESKEISSVWISALKEKIDSCILNLDDPFIKIISERIELDDHYEVEFRENKPLGVVLERSNESAIVKMSNFKVYYLFNNFLFIHFISSFIVFLNIIIGIWNRSRVCFNFYK